MNHDLLEKLKHNVEKVLGRAAAAAGRAGRSPDEVTLVGVTKTVDIETAGLLIEAGVKDLAENRVQEGERKHAALGDRCRWHMIGHLQTNKIKKALGFSKTIHSVDSERLAREISRRGVTADLKPDVLLEVNVSGEESKYGLAPDEAAGMAALAKELPGLALRGLMTMAPYDPDPEEARPFFRALTALFHRLKESGIVDDRFDTLSMGMSGDFEVAVEEGATLIRVGTALYEGV